MHLLKRGQIAYLKVNKALIEVLSEYADFANVFLSKLVAELSEHIEINNFAIKLVND